MVAMCKLGSDVIQAFHDSFALWRGAVSVEQQPQALLSIYLLVDGTAKQPMPPALPVAQCF